jgi:hypothetical protein
MLMDLMLTTPVKMATTSMKEHSCFLPLSHWGNNQYGIRKRCACQRERTSSPNVDKGFLSFNK